MSWDAVEYPDVVPEFDRFLIQRMESEWGGVIEW